MFQNIDPVSVDVAFGCYQIRKIAVQPTIPSFDVLPESLDRDSALIKLAGTLGEALQADCRRAQFTVGMDLVAEKIKSFFGSADISFYRMQAQLQDSEHLIHLPYRLPELLSGFESQLFHPGFSLLLLSHASL